MIDDRLKPIPKKIVCNNEKLETQVNVLMKFYKKKYYRKPIASNYKYKLKLKRGKLLPSERTEILGALFKINFYEDDYYPHRFRKYYEKKGIVNKR